jgi:hypothetical protein
LNCLQSASATSPVWSLTWTYDAFGNRTQQTTEPVGDFPSCYRVATTEQALLEFSETTWMFFFMLISADRSCAVLCTKNDYYLVGGSLPFVTAASGNIAEAVAAFASFAESRPLPVMKSLLCEVSSRYGPPMAGWNPDPSRKPILLLPPAAESLGSD